MTESVQMFEREVASDFIVDDHRTHRVPFQFATYKSRGDAALFQIGEQVDIEKKPVSEDDQAFDAAVEQHLEVALEAAALVVYVSENWQVGSLVESVLDASEHERTVRIGHVEDHDADGVAPFTAQGAGELIGTIAQLFRSTLDALLSHRRNIA